MDTSIIINATTTDGKKVAKSITNINPAKTNAILNEFATRVNNLSTNTYAGGTRINKNALTEADQTAGTLTVNTENFTGTAPTVSNIDGGKRLTFDGSGYIDVTFG